MGSTPKPKPVPRVAPARARPVRPGGMHGTGGPLGAPPAHRADPPSRGMPEQRAAAACIHNASHLACMRVPEMPLSLRSDDLGHARYWAETTLTVSG